MKKKKLDEARITNLLGYVQQLKKLPFFEKLLKTNYTSDGIAALIRDNTGNAIEIEMRPAGKARLNWGSILKKKKKTESIKLQDLIQ